MFYHDSKQIITFSKEGLILKDQLRTIIKSISHLVTVKFKDIDLFKIEYQYIEDEFHLLCKCEM